MRVAVEKLLSKNVGIIHFVGIGGIGMSGIAEIFYNLGYKVQGSDISENYITERLKELGIKIFLNHHIENIKDAGMIVRSTAIRDDNPEIIAAKALNLIIIKRSDMLAELMRLKLSIAIAGSHGKTTTTSLVACMLENAGLDPTVINGGIINSKNTNAYLGSGDFLVAEADESDATFIKIPSTIGVITNIDAEHLDFYKDFSNLKKAFRDFIENLPFYGFGVLCKDHPEVRILADEIVDRRILTYGIDSEDVNIRAINISSHLTHSNFDVEVKEPFHNNSRIIKNICLPIVGIHNVLNSLAAISIGVQLKLKDETIVNSFNNFKGVKRRFTKTGEVDGITIVDDYAHHPQEIIATLKTAKILSNARKSRIIAIVQPHRYSRVKDLFKEFINCFTDADYLIVSDIYGASESPIEGITSQLLVDSIKQQGYLENVILLDDPKNLPKHIKSVAKRGDLVLFMGAGNITYWANRLPKELNTLI